MTTEGHKNEFLVNDHFRTILTTIQVAQIQHETALMNSVRELQSMKAFGGRSVCYSASSYIQYIKVSPFNID